MEVENFYFHLPRRIFHSMTDTVRKYILFQIILLVPITFNKKIVALTFSVVLISTLSNCCGPFLLSLPSPRNHQGQDFFCCPSRSPGGGVEKKKINTVSCLVLDSLVTIVGTPAFIWTYSVYGSWSFASITVFPNPVYF